MAMLSAEMKKIAENYPRAEVKYAVLTVPSYLRTPAQSLVSKLFVSSTSSLLPLSPTKEEKKTWSTISLMVLLTCLCLPSTIASLRSLPLTVTLTFESKNSNDITTDNNSLHKLRREVEKAKRSLSAVAQTTIEIEALIDGIDFSENLILAKFEKLNIDLFKKTLTPMLDVLKDADVKKMLTKLSSLAALAVSPISRL